MLLEPLLVQARGPVSYLHGISLSRKHARWRRTLRACDAEWRERCGKGQEGDINEQNIDFEIHSNHLCELAVLVSQRSGHQEGQGKEGGSWSYHDVCRCCRFVRLPDF